MHANQWEAGQVVVEKNIVVPACFGMTVVALLALLALVNIVFSMTLDTGGFHLVFFDFALVAVRTCKLLVLATKREVCFLVVIKFMFMPGFGVVAVFAFLAVFAFVTVIVFMAAVAISWQFLFFLFILFQDFGCMAAVASRFFVLAK